jgi:cytochrome c6
MSRFIVGSLFALFPALFVACGDEPGTDGGDAVEGDAAAGKAVYEARCAVCHGAAGQGAGNYPAVAGEGGSEAIEIVTNGDGSMPAFRGQLTEQEIADVVAYIETL